MIFAGPTMRPFLIWAAMVRHYKPDILIHEITFRKGISTQMLEREFGELYEIHTMVNFSPSDLGWPCFRPRQMSWLFLRETIRFAGSVKHFQQLFFKSPVVSARAFWDASPAYHDKVMLDAARERGHSYSCADQVDIMNCMTPAQGRRFQQYVDLKDSFCGNDGTFIFDVEQDPGFGSGGPLVMTMVSHGTLVNMTGEQPRLAGGLTHLAIMGDPVFKPLVADHSHTCPFQDLADAGVVSEACWKILQATRSMKHAAAPCWHMH